MTFTVTSRSYVSNTTQNIFVLQRGPDWWVKIGDFGLKTRVLEGLTGFITFNGAPSFVAPEVYEMLWDLNLERERTREVFTSKVDIWSVGVITYYLLTCRLPFPERSDLLAYSRDEGVLPETYLARNEVSQDTYSFLDSLLAPEPSERPSAKDTLEHAWLKPLQDELEAADMDEGDPSNPDLRPSPLNMRTTHASKGMVLPYNINSCDPIHPAAFEVPLNLPSPTSLGIDGNTYKQLMNTLGTGAISKPNQSTADDLSIAQSQNSESQCSEQSQIRLNHDRLNPADMSPIETLPPYIRRGSDTAPIPVDEELRNESPRPYSTRSSNRNSVNTSFSDRWRRVSSNMMHNRTQPSSTGKKGGGELEKRKERMSEEKETEAPSSPTRLVQLKYVLVQDSFADSDHSSGKKKAPKNKSQIIELPYRSQFGEGLPLFPMRTKKEKG